MKIALVILHADPARGGAERYTVDLARALRHRGHDASIIASSAPPAGLEVPVVNLDARNWTRERRYECFLDRLEQHLSAEPYDIVHAMLPVRRCDFYHPHAGVAAEQLKRWTTLFNPRRQMMAAIEHKLLTGEHPPITLVLSDYVKQFMTTDYPTLAPDRLVRLFNGIDLERFDPGPSIPDSPADRPCHALIIAQDFERKGLRQTIEAIARLDIDKFKLTVVGGDDAMPYATLARRLGVDVTFAGRTDDPRPFYRQADVFVLPTRHDPCSLVVLEALAMGLPVISTKQNGACEIMQSGRHGFVLEDSTNLDALAAALQQMLDPELRRSMRQACLELRPELSQQRHVERLIELYESSFAHRSAT
jgi:UDP-glucose:(heptosyl)LPS alpha-1,3-glucosyltransferase